MKDVRNLWFHPVEERWDPRFFERYFETPLGAAIRAREEEAVYDFLGTVLEPGHSVLEVGPGTGNYTVPVAHRCSEMVAIDPSSEMLQYLRKRLLQEGMLNVETGTGQLPDKLGATPGRFDGALLVGVLNYTEYLVESLRALVSALKPGGWIIFNVPLLTLEGRIYALSELVSRRRVYLLSPADILATAETAGLKIENTVTTGLSHSGLTLVVGAVVQKASPGEPT
jgi:2-polyprenyl-3-methyl-5-hydroxy-6-metoxy-1,4-benzoquinol methylase